MGYGALHPLLFSYFIINFAPSPSKYWHAPDVLNIGHNEFENHTFASALLHYWITASYDRELIKQIGTIFRRCPILRT